MIERTFIQQNLRKIELENYVKGMMDRAGVTRLDIVKTPLVTRIVITAAHPGFAIGKGGSNIKKVTREIERKFKIENPQIEIKEIPNPNLDAKTIAHKMKNMLERGYSWRSVAYKVMRDVKEANAHGSEIILSGALGGKGQRKKKQRFASGYMKKTGEYVKLVDYAKISAYPKYGAIGIKIRIVHPDVVFPDKINVLDSITPPTEEARVEAKTETAEKTEETKKAGEKTTETKKEAPKPAAKEKKADSKAEKKPKAKKAGEKTKTSPKKEEKAPAAEATKAEKVEKKKEEKPAAETKPAEKKEGKTAPETKPEEERATQEEKDAKEGEQK